MVRLAGRLSDLVEVNRLRTEPDLQTQRCKLSH